MSFEIDAPSIVTKHYLNVDSTGVSFSKGAVLGGARRFSFSQIECVLLSIEHELSFQVGKEIFSIPTKPEDAQHQAAIEMLVREARRTTAPETC
jgi:hypothetical protein